MIGSHWDPKIVGSFNQRRRTLTYDESMAGVLNDLIAGAERHAAKNPGTDSDFMDLGGLRPLKRLLLEAEVCQGERIEAGLKLAWEQMASNRGILDHSYGKAIIGDVVTRIDSRILALEIASTVPENQR